MSSKKHYLNQAGNSIQGHFQNHGVQLNGNNISVGGNFTINTHLNEKNVEKECRKALRNGLTDPIDDRDKILSLKPRMVTATCDWITENERYKYWRNIRTRSQLLWVSGGQARGKTMLAIFLTQEFDRRAKQAGEITVLYYFIDRQDGRDTAVHVMRGLIWRLISVRKNLISHLLEEYETQPDSVFGPNSIETLWRVFENMVRDPSAGQVYCVIDGLDSCTEDSLRRLVGRVRNFFLDEPQTVLDEGGPEDSSRQSRPSTLRRPPIRDGAGLKMMLVSREEPEWLIEELKGFPRVPLGGGSKKGKAAAGTSARPPKKAPKLADVAKTIIRKQTLQKTTNTSSAAAGPSSASATPHTSQSYQSEATTSPTTTSALTLAHGFPSTASPSGSQMAFSSGGIVITSGPSPENPSATPETSTASNGALVLANTPVSEQPGTLPSSSNGMYPSNTFRPAVESSSVQSELALPNTSFAAASPIPTAHSPIQPVTGDPSISAEQPLGSTSRITSASPTSASGSVPSTLVSHTVGALSSPPGYAVPSQSHTISPSPGTHLPNDAPPEYHHHSTDATGASPSMGSAQQGPNTQPAPVELATELPTHIQNGSFRSDEKKPYVVTPASEPVFHGAAYTDEPAEFTDEKPHQPTVTEEPVEEDATEVGEVADDEEDEDYNPSLRLYIEARIEELSKEKQYTTAVQSFICAALEYRGDGTFLWVDFAVEELRKVQIDVIEDATNSLPPTLDEMYSRILLNIDPSLVDLVVGLLRWTVCARRPMDLLELTVALNLSHFGTQGAMAFILNAITACGNMIKIGEEDMTVNLVHQSVVDFLTAEDSIILSDPRLAKFHINPGQIDGDIATFCISYLESGPFNEKAISQAQNPQEYQQHILQHPFVPYAASFWPDHLKEASNPILNLSSPFFLPKSKARKNWWKTYWAFTTGKVTWVAPSNFNVLHLAAYLNLVPVAQQVAQRGELQSRINKRDSHGMTPLDYTVALGHIPMFTFLVQYGAKQEPLGETILELAVRKGQREMVVLLLDMGWDVNMRAQQLNPMGSLYTMARWLPGAFNEGLDLNRDNWSMMFKDIGVQETPLHQAATYGHLAVMELLLDRGADISAGTTKGFSPLHSASYTGQLQCVELLVERGSNINWVTTDNWLPLHYAAMRGKTAVVEYFLDKGVPIDSLNMKSKTALHLASYAGHAELVQTLVERGANMELKSYKGETPLHLATRHTKPQVVEILLSLGADRSAVNNDGFTALQVAQASTLIDSKECARILLTFGLDGYVPWKPPAPLNPQQTGQIDPNTQAYADDQSSAVGGDGAAEDHEARRASMVPSGTTARTFGHTAPTRAPTFQGFEANISVHVHPPQQPSSAFNIPHQPVQPVHPDQNAGASRPNLGTAYSDPAGGVSKFTYDANGNMPQHTSQDAGMAFGSMSPPNVPPPPYSAAVQGSPPQVFPEKSPAWTAQTNQYPAQPNLPVQGKPPASAPATPPVQNSLPVAGSASQTTPPLNQTTSSRSIPQQSGPSSMVQMLSAMAISNTRSPSPAPQTPQVAAAAPVMQAPSTPVQATQPYQAQANSQYQAPVTHNLQPTSPALLMSPFQPAATPVSPFQVPASPFQQFPQQQQQQQQQPQPQLQAQVSHFQPPQQAFPQPLHYTAGLNMQSTTPSPYTSTPVPQPSQLLSPSPTPYGQPQQAPTPGQSPHFSGNSTASTYNSSYNYSAPPVTAPYNPNLGQVPQVQTQPTNGPWMGQPNNGMMFAPPPPQLQKKKSFLGGLVNGR